MNLGARKPQAISFNILLDNSLARTKELSLNRPRVVSVAGNGTPLFFAQDIHCRTQFIFVKSGNTAFINREQTNITAENSFRHLLSVVGKREEVSGLEDQKANRDGVEQIRVQILQTV